MKKIISAIMALLLTLSFSSMVFADEEDSYEYWMDLAQNYENTNCYEASVAYEKAGDLVPEEIEYSYMIKSEAYNKAYDMFVKAVNFNQHPSDIGITDERFTILTEKAADCFAKRERKSQATEYYNKAGTHYIDAGNKDFAVLCFEKAGDIFFELKNYEKAISNYKIALNNISVDSTETGTIYDKLSKSYLETGDKEQAAYNKMRAAGYISAMDFENGIEVYKEAIELYSQTDDKEGLHTTYKNLLSTFLTNNRMNEAIPFLLDYADILDNKTEAITYINFAAFFYEENGDYAGIGYTYEKIGNIYKDLEDFPSAANAYEKSAEAYRKAYCMTDAERVEKLAEECNPTGTIFSGGNPFVIIGGAIIIAAAIIFAATRKK